MKPPRKNPVTPSKPRTAPKPTHWGEVAGWYDQLVGDAGSEYHQEVIIPGVLRMLGLKHDSAQQGKHLRILDLACGQGVLCRKLARAGCKVVGVDAAETLIESARQRESETGEGRVDYHVADATRLIDGEGKLTAAWARAGSFDAVTIVLAIQNMTPLSPVWQACRGLLKEGGMLVVVMMHPCFRVPKKSDWLWLPEGGLNGHGRQMRVVEQYLGSEKIEIQTHPGLAAHGKDEGGTAHFHRPLQAYVNTLGNAGLWIDHVDEWVSHKISQAGPRKAELDRSRKEIPMFLAIRARRS